MSMVKFVKNLWGWVALAITPPQRPPLPLCRPRRGALPAYRHPVAIFFFICAICISVRIRNGDSNNTLQALLQANA